MEFLRRQHYVVFNFNAIASVSGVAFDDLPGGLDIKPVVFERGAVGDTGIKAEDAAASPHHRRDFVFQLGDDIRAGLPENMFVDATHEGQPRSVFIPEPPIFRIIVTHPRSSVRFADLPATPIPPPPDTPDACATRHECPATAVRPQHTVG